MVSVLVQLLQLYQQSFLGDYWKQLFPSRDITAIEGRGKIKEERIALNKYTVTTEPNKHFPTTPCCTIIFTILRNMKKRNKIEIFHVQKFIQKSLLLPYFHQHHCDYYHNITYEEI